ncbi:non-canonical purine NTP pyrophosphatase [Candidatus Beckwithbacteria bacterium CG22_combo_CG10-13_8_21_14_all_01_47_9]|uniref:Non-canonical purine NTP pyrophosphatase n=4 Tax=Candidatus Beckwithiibacteriota TaxID=1752726 RepID=A0A2H0E3U1_9BACT|nr:MAG: hypothetical protein AUJ59_00445 [Candidatus Beckwithbacteria bacterium CG1_02_47_37]PIP88490.1 MAG: non-canonical purine NTP pyrophosphatase [Candidatus Beckwithbacteria bacterium CG22_combo_CG10-13_8_21_14_all_01_47_9]PJC66692.1 MAG: non-canonical purine NTP pyrophosphatase [Candidatus Beckwithbacteria bacterium CG_4_9_14_0_2_um_filter_47_11]
MSLLLATTNKDKILEYRVLLKNIKFQVVKKLPVVAETGKTFAENAIIKAKAYGEKFKLPTLCDDTGLEIKALNNFPGIYSNRFAGGDFSRARKDILKKLTTDRRARFVCVLALYLPESGKVKTFTGMVSGKIGMVEKRGYGFGYDPIFIYPGPKNQVSHRARAVKKFLVYNQKHEL